MRGGDRFGRAVAVFGENEIRFRQVHAIAIVDLGRKPLGSSTPNAARQARKAWSSNAAGRRHDAVAGELVHRASIPLHQRPAPVGEIGHDLSEPLGSHRCRNVHSTHNIGGHHRYLGVVRRRCHRGYLRSTTPSAVLTGPSS
jgi:hypothetical protein